MRTNQITQARRDAISAAINLKDLAEGLAGIRWRGNTCSCCFHGQDSKPSMYYYPDSNRIYCFGCPPGEQSFDPVWFVKQLNGWSMARAARWLEKEYKLAKFAEEEVADGEEEDGRELSWAEISNRFLKIAHTMEATAEERLSVRKRYWDAYQTKNKLRLASMMGLEEVTELLQKLGLQHEEVGDQ